MNYCRECGSRLNEKGDTCPECGLRYAVVDVPNAHRVVKTNALSIIGMIVGIISIIFSMWGVMSVLAIIISSIARKQINEGNENGDSMAIVGICCGTISLMILVSIWSITSGL